MNRISSFLAVAVVLMGLGLLSAQQKPDQAKPEQGKAEQAAQAAAESWLALVDAGNYDQSWEEAASIFKEQVTKEQWKSAVGMVQNQVGKLQSRKLKSASYAKNPPSAPPGEYVNIQYASKFQNLPAALESITPMLDKDGKWRVSGYFVKPAE